MKLLDESLLREASFNRMVVKFQFFETYCKKCIKTKLMKKRDCDLLYGYKKPCCDLMDKFVEKENKEINDKMLDKALQHLLYNFQVKNEK